MVKVNTLACFRIPKVLIFQILVRNVVVCNLEIVKIFINSTSLYCRLCDN